MRAVTFQSVLNGVAIALGLNPQRDLNPARAQMLTEYINRRLETCWKFEFWPEWTPCEQRALRLAWNPATAYPAPAIGAPQEVWFPPTNTYYQALAANTNFPPALEVAGTWLVDGLHWAIAAQGFGVPTWSGDIYYLGASPVQAYTLPDWQPNTAYNGGAVLGTPGDQVRNPNDNQFYQCVVAHVSGLTFDATKFGLLTPFNKYISLDQPGFTAIGQVKRVCKRDPYVYPKTPGEIPFRISGKGIQLKQDAPGLVYVEYRQRPPVFTSTPWSSTAAYVTGNVTYGSDGNGYLALQNSANQNPVTQAAYWQLIPFPEVLATSVKRFALSDAYRDQKQNDRAKEEEEAAREELQDVWDAEVASQGQWASAAVETYGS